MEQGKERVTKDELVMFSVVRDTKCVECGKDIFNGEFLRMEKGQPLCMACADLDHLVFLPRGGR